MSGELTLPEMTGTTPGWSHTHCAACRGLAWRAPDGAVFCGTCEERAARLAAVMQPRAQCMTLRSALLASSNLTKPVAMPMPIHVSTAGG